MTTSESGEAVHLESIRGLPHMQLWLMRSAHSEKGDGLWRWLVRDGSRTDDADGEPRFVCQGPVLGFATARDALEDARKLLPAPRFWEGLLWT